MKLGDLGERKIIDNLFREFNISAEKDDCALVENGDEYLLLSTDIIRESTHIPKGATASQIGRFLANLNLSDIAAMAGKPTGMLVSYLVRPDTDESFFREIVSGISGALKDQNADLLGGDTKEGSELVISGTVLGHQKKELVRQRKHIAKGQIIGVTNNLGKSASGYVFYKSKYKKSLGIELMMNITPRIREAQIISEHGGKFMMDLSDGLFSSIHQMKSDYGTGFKIVEDELPADSHVKKASEISGRNATEIICQFGGDYELLFSIDNNNYKDFMDSMESEKVRVAFIGEAWEGNNIIYDGKRWSPIRETGYEHFSAKPHLGYA